CSPRHSDADHQLCVIADPKIFVLRYGVQFAKLHAESNFGLDITMMTQRFGIAHTREFVHRDAVKTWQKIGWQSFKYVQDILLLDKGHFAVDLRKFRLSVCTQIFITETFYDLKIFVHTTDHQELLECLRRLGQGIKLTLIHARWHHKVTCSFWSGFDQIWRFDFAKVEI